FELPAGDDHGAEAVGGEVQGVRTGHLDWFAGMAGNGAERRQAVRAADPEGPEVPGGDDLPYGGFGGDPADRREGLLVEHVHDGTVRHIEAGGDPPGGRGEHVGTGRRVDV